MEPTSHSEGGVRHPAPSLAEVQAAFPQLEILEMIGQGGMGSVFKARQPKLNRLVALKLLPASLGEGDAAFAGRFEREGQLLARLHHPNIVAVHDSGTGGQFFYLIMEYVDGVNLRQAMRAKRFTPRQALAIVPHICDALQFAHDEGVLHRDIKPENILLDSKGRVKLADFGIAKLLAEPGAPAPGTPPADVGFTHAGTTLGTPSYMAPEQRDTPDDVDNRADIYSLGVVFYELLTGELPLERFSPPSAKSGADPRVDAIVGQALEAQRERRQRSAGEMKTQVEGVTNRSVGSEARQETPLPWVAMVIHALLAVAFLLFLGMVVPRFLAVFKDMAGPLKLPAMTHFIAVLSSHFWLCALSILAAFLADVGLCILLSRKLPRGLRPWSFTVILVSLAIFGIMTMAMFVPMRPMMTQLAGDTSSYPIEASRPAPPTRAGSESWSYTPRYLLPEKVAGWTKSPQTANAGWSVDISLEQKAGVVTLSGPRERMRRLATLLRVFDQPEAKRVMDLPLLNMPPEFFLRMSLPGLMERTEYARTRFTDSLFETLKREGVTASQLGRALSSHVLELEKATFMNTGTPFDNIVHSPGASTYYDVTIPCADQPQKPLTLSIERTTQEMGTQSKFAAFAPWLIVEAKKLPQVAVVAPPRTLGMDAEMLTATKGKLWKSEALDLKLRDGVRDQRILVMEFAPFDRPDRVNPPQAQVKLSLETVPQGLLNVSSSIGTANFEDVRLEEKDGVRTMTITRAVETTSRPDNEKTERILKKYWSCTFTYEFEGGTLILGGFPEGVTDWGVATFTVPDRKIAFTLSP